MILIVDDIKENVYSLQKVLAHHGFEVDTAFSGEEALKKILLKSYILVILDVQMPGIDGFEVAENIKGFKKAKDTAIIFLSANSTDTELIIKGYNQGARDYITKPVDTDILLLKVKSLYEIYESRHQSTQQQNEMRALYDKEKEANLLLSKRVQKLEDAFKIIKAGSWEFDPVSKHIYASPELYSVIHLNPESEVINWEFVMNNLSEGELEQLANLTQNESFEFTHPYQMPEGQIRNLKFFVKIDHNTEGSKKVTGVVQDMSAL